MLGQRTNICIAKSSSDNDDNDEITNSYFAFTVINVKENPVFNEPSKFLVVAVEN